MGIFLKGFLLLNMQYSSVESILRETIKTTKLKVVAKGNSPLIFSGHPATNFLVGCCRESLQQPSTFSCHVPSSDKKNLGSSP